MKFIISSSELYAYLQALSKVVPSRSVVPLVESFLFDISSEGLKITATDLETTLVAQIELDNIEGEGKVAIESKRLLDIIKEFSQQPLIFEINEENYEVVIKTESGKYSIPGNSLVDEYPEPAKIDKSIASNFMISAETLRKGIDNTFFSISEDELRPVMNGIYFDLKEDSLTFVSSDSHKLIRYRRTDLGFDRPASFILSKKPAELLKNILTKIDEDVKVEFDERNATFEMPNYTIVCRLIEGNYPNYDAVLPKENDKEVNIDKANFYNTIKRVSLFANEASKLVKFSFAENEVEITAQDIDFSISAFEKISCLYDSEPITLGFKSTFLLDVLHNISAKDITISMTDTRRGTLVYPTQNDENEDIVMLVMPMMLDEEY